VYSATKFAVRSLTEGLRQELRDAKSKIRVTAISPGYVETGFAAHYHKDEAAAQKTYGRFKVLESDDIAEAVLYVLSCPDYMEVHDVLMRPTAQSH
jgi:NADP-dependent 3-hydroxy acid dehydrogenase YdfG